MGVLSRPWSGAPLLPAIVAALAGVSLLYGAVLHLLEHLTGQRSWTVEVPGWLAAYFTSLLLLDTAAALLLALRTRTGLVLAVTVLATDAVANGYANLVLDPTPGLTTGRVVTAGVAGLAVALAFVLPHLWPRAR